MMVTMSDPEKTVIKHSNSEYLSSLLNCLTSKSTLCGHRSMVLWVVTWP